MDLPVELPVDRPVLTFPQAEAEALGAAYRAASVILEYGSGGSTVLASDMGKTVFSVESDKGWLAQMQLWFDGQKPKGRVVLHHGDIGPTGKWGMPKAPRSFRNWPRYALSVWERPDFEQPDVILVDGRFRPACLMATAFRTRRPVRVFFDDYAGRPSYHAVEEMFRPVALHGRMAEFHLDPTPIPVDRLDWIISLFLRPQ